MRINMLYKSILVAATLCVAPAAFSGSPNGSPPRVRSVVTGKGIFGNDASNLLQQIRADALGVKNDADELRAFTRTPFLIDWISDGGQLTNIRGRVNDMDKLLVQLRENQSEALPWQQQAIDRIAPTVVNLTDTTEAAIVSFNQYQNEVFYSDVPGLAADMYDQARLIDKTLGNFGKSVEARHEPQQLNQTQVSKNNP